MQKQLIKYRVKAIDIFCTHVKHRCQPHLGQVRLAGASLGLLFPPLCHQALPVPADPRSLWTARNDADGKVACFVPAFWRRCQLKGDALNTANCDHGPHFVTLRNIFPTRNPCNMRMASFHVILLASWALSFACLVPSTHQIKISLNDLVASERTTLGQSVWNFAKIFCSKTWHLGCHPSTFTKHSTRPSNFTSLLSNATSKVWEWLGEKSNSNFHDHQHQALWSWVIVPFVFHLDNRQNLMSKFLLFRYILHFPVAKSKYIPVPDAQMKLAAIHPPEVVDISCALKMVNLKCASFQMLHWSPCQFIDFTRADLVNLISTHCLEGCNISTVSLGIKRMQTTEKF